MHHWHREAAFHIPKKDLLRLKEILNPFRARAMSRGKDSPEAILTELLYPLIEAYDQKAVFHEREEKSTNVRLFLTIPSDVWESAVAASDKDTSPKVVIRESLKGIFTAP